MGSQVDAALFHNLPHRLAPFLAVVTQSLFGSSRSTLVPGDPPIGHFPFLQLHRVVGWHLEACNENIAATCARGVQ